MKLPLSIATLVSFALFRALDASAADANNVNNQAAAAADKVTVTVANELDAARPAEMIVVPWADIAARIPGAQPDHLLVKDAATGAVVASQFTNFHPDDGKGVYDEVLFEHDFAKGEHSAVFTLEKTSKPVAPFPALVFGRYVPERLDDFAWETDHIAHRIYGQGLESPEAGKSKMTSSGIDVWCKRVRYPIVDRFYLRGHDHYHIDNGDGLDMYDVGLTRGCGGTGVWDGKTLFVSHNWKTWKVLANGPIRTIFELTYEPWDIGNGTTASETKRFTVDAGHNLDQIQSTFTIQGGTNEITAAIGLGKVRGVASVETTLDAQHSWMSRWQIHIKNGQVGVGMILNPGAPIEFAEDPKNQLALTKVKSGVPVCYYAGACWDQSGDFTTKEAWNAYLAAFSDRLRSPVKVAVSGAK